MIVMVSTVEPSEQFWNGFEGFYSETAHGSRLFVIVSTVELSEQF